MPDWYAITEFLATQTLLTTLTENDNAVGVFETLVTAFDLDSKAGNLEHSDLAKSIYGPDEPNPNPKPDPHPPTKPPPRPRPMPGM